MTEGEVCPDEENSAQIGPSAATRPPKPVPNGQWLGPPFLDPAFFAIIGTGLMSHPGIVGLDRSTPQLIHRFRLQCGKLVAEFLGKFSAACALTSNLSTCTYIAAPIGTMGGVGLLEEDYVQIIPNRSR